jgi:protein-L-isoaspartate(D-aspartate) O-methyltransferase
MVRDTIVERGVQDPRVLEAMRRVPRHEFVHEGERRHAYEDRPLPIGHGQTISQPYIVAIMAEVAEIAPDARVLEIGTGSGYGAAVLAEIAKDVYTIEIVEPLAEEAGRTLARLGYENVHVRAGDGYRGWPEEAPFDAILVTAAPEKIPPPLLSQLKPGGLMVIPVGAFYQELKVIERREDGYLERGVLPVRFVPFVGEAERPQAEPSDGGR